VQAAQLAVVVPSLLGLALGGMAHAYASARVLCSRRVCALKGIVWLTKLFTLGTDGESPLVLVERSMAEVAAPILAEQAKGAAAENKQRVYALEVLDELKRTARFVHADAPLPLFAV